MPGVQFNPLTGQPEIVPDDWYEAMMLQGGPAARGQARPQQVNPLALLPPPIQQPSEPAPELTESPGAMSHVLDVLGLLDRPRNAIASAVRAGQLGQSPWQAAGEGWRGERNTSWGDVFNVQEGKPTDDWGTWLGKEGTRFAADALLDPLNLIPLLKIPKAVKGLSTYKRAAEAAYGSSLGRVFLPGVPEHQAEVAGIKEAALRGMRERSAPVLEKISEAKPLEAEAMKAIDAGEAGLRPYAVGGADELALRQLYERNTGLVPDNIKEVYDWLHSQSAERLGTINEQLRRLGQKEIAPIAEDDWYKWVPRVMTQAGEREIPRTAGAGGIQEQEFGRRILKRAVRDNPAEEFNPQGLNKPMVVNMEHPEWSKLTQFPNDPYHPKDWFIKYDEPFEKAKDLIPVKLTEATLKDIIDAGITKEKTFIPGAMESYGHNILKKDRQIAFLEYVTNLLGKGNLLKPVEEIARTSMLGATDTALPAGWRQLKVPGFEQHAAPKWLANDIEKASRKLFDPDTPLGALEEIGVKMMDTKIGRLLHDATSWWKSNTLGIGGIGSFYIGNLVSNLPQMYLGGVNPALIPVRSFQASAVQRGIGGDVVRGYANDVLKKEFQVRDLVGGRATWSGSEAEDVLGAAKRGKGRVREAVEDWYQPMKAVGEGAASVGEAIGAANKWMLSNVGSAIEDNARIGVAIDWIKRNVKGRVATAEDLDKAAMFAKKAMIDYDALTPAERIIKNFIPFYAWQRGMLGRTMEVVTTRPDKLARLGRFLDTILDPMDPWEKQIADPWVKESSPVTGIMGTPLDRFMSSPTGDPQTWLANRFLPHGNIEQMMARPKDFLGSIVNPLIKAPIELGTNWSSFKKRGVDEVAPDFLRMMGGPLTGSQYEPAPMRLFGQSIPQSWDYMVSNAPGGRIAKNVSQLTDIAGLTQNPGAQRTNEAPWTETGLGLATGFKFYPYDVTKFMTRRKYEHQEKINRIKAKWNLAMQRNDQEQAEQYSEMWVDMQGRLAEAYGFTN